MMRSLRLSSLACRSGAPLLAALVAGGSVATAPLVAAPRVQPSSRRAASRERPNPLVGAGRVLRYVTTAQEAYFAAHQSYTTDQTALQQALKSSWGDSVRVQILFADQHGWTGQATHPAAPGKSCVIFVGNAANLPSLPRTAAEGKLPREQGVPVCDS